MKNEVPLFGTGNLRGACDPNGIFMKIEEIISFLISSAIFESPVLPVQLPFPSICGCISCCRHGKRRTREITIPGEFRWASTHFGSFHFKVQQQSGTRREEKKGRRAVMITKSTTTGWRRRISRKRRKSGSNEEEKQGTDGNGAIGVFRRHPSFSHLFSSYCCCCDTTFPGLGRPKTETDRRGATAAAAGEEVEKNDRSPETVAKLNNLYTKRTRSKEVSRWKQFNREIQFGIFRVNDQFQCPSVFVHTTDTDDDDATTSSLWQWTDGEGHSVRQTVALVNQSLGWLGWNDKPEWISWECAGRRGRVRLLRKGQRITSLINIITSREETPSSDTEGDLSMWWLIR